MSFRIVPAVRKDTNLIICLAGPSGSGKTYSAMLLAKGICGDDRFLVIDTESRRGLHYADTFDFDHIDFAPPFTPERYAEAVELGIEKGYKAIVVDSISHEWDGEGGVKEDAEKNNIPGPGAWKDPKARHQKMVGKFLQARTSLIFCCRADEKIDMSKKDHRGRMIIEPRGWVPIQEKRWMYEMTLSMTLANTAPGVVDLSLPHKVQDQHRTAFPIGNLISMEAGQILGRWAKGETIENPDKELWDKMREVAHDGTEKMKEYAAGQLSEDERVRLKPIRAELLKIAKQADEEHARWIQSMDHREPGEDDEEE